MNRKLLPSVLAASLLGTSGASLASDMDGLIDRAARGDVEAQRSVGRAFLSGDGLPLDPARGIRILEQLNRGPHVDPFDAARIASHYERIGEARASATWYRSASLAGHTGAQIKVAQLLLSSSTDPALAAENQTRAREQALGLLRHAANAGNADAAYRLFGMHARGEHVASDRVEANRYLRLAADSGHAQAAYAVGLQSLQSDRKIGRTADPVVAQGYFELAARGGSVEATRRVVAFLLESTPPDLERATYWATHAKDLGDASLLSTVDVRRLQVEHDTLAGVTPLPRVALDATPVPESVVTLAAPEFDLTNVALPALVAVSIAAPRGEPMPQTPPTKRTSPASAGEPQALAGASALPTAEAAAYQALMAEMAEMRAQMTSYQQQVADLSTVLAERDRALSESAQNLRSLQAERSAEAEALRIAKIAQEASHKNEAGLGAMRAGNYTAAFNRFTVAADAGNTQAMNNLATLYLRGQGVEASVDRAVEYFRQAADAGNAQAAVNLGTLFARGLHGAVVDTAAAVTWYRRAHVLHHPRAGDYLHAMGVTPPTESESLAIN